jgi:zinc/manganese transport system substrate-binding protein
VVAPLRGDEDGSKFDPHWWHDPRNAARAVSDIRDALVKADPARREAYDGNARSYLAQLHSLDRDIAECIGQLPRPRRKLVTDHDSLGYFARRYSLEIIGAVIPSQTTEAQPSAGELADLASLIEREDVRAVFPERDVNAKLSEALARQTGASADFELYTDTLGPKGSGGETYVEMEQSNAASIVDGLSEGRARCVFVSQ